MRTPFIIPLVLMSMVSFPSWGLTMDDLVQRDGLYYQRFTDVPFTGEIDEGLARGSFDSGKKKGTWTIHYDSGLVVEENYKNGEQNGMEFTYYPNGQLFHKGNKKGIYMDGLWVFYHEDGQLMSKSNWKNGEREGPSVHYHKNGQLSSEGEYKNGKMEGTWVFYNEDGTKRMSEVKVGTRIFDEGSGVYHRGKKVSD